MMSGCAIRRLLLVLAATAVSAEAAMHNGEEVQGSAGWLHVNGVMQEPACHLAMASRWQTVTLPPVTTDDLKRPGDSAQVTPFYIRLNGCVRTAGTVADSQNNTVKWSDWQPIATLTFSGVADANAPALFKAKGVEGMGLRLRDAAGNALQPGVKSHPLFLMPGDDMLYFSLGPERTSARLQAGSYSAILDFQIHYQ
ncbi:fimbrial protein [Pantoea sp. USHLN256]|uniref:fimbrial protein n=1 Tax=Pantoea sp. USHLN256 TaxID=3081293 RepID=UPI00301A9C0D